MRTLYHEFESLEHLLANRLLPGGSSQPIRFVVFGGTGAVGGASVLELCRIILMSRELRQPPLAGEIYATGIADKDISNFASRLYLALGEEVEIEKIEPRRHYRIDGRIDLRFDLLQLQVPQDLEQRTARRQAEHPGMDLEAALQAELAEQPCPFLSFVEGLDQALLHAVMVAIPLPSVATYTLGAIDRLLAKGGFDHATLQRVKKDFLRTFIRGLAVIQQRHARHVVIAHTTAVGGMYRVDGGRPEIRLGFAHSALGKRLVDKKYFAEELTQLYLDHGFDVLETAAAIGIDGVEFRQRLPLDRAVRRKLAERVEAIEPPPVAASDVDSANILLYPNVRVPLIFEEPDEEETAEEDGTPEAVDEATSEAAAAEEQASKEETGEEASEEAAELDGEATDETAPEQEPNGFTPEAAPDPDAPIDLGAGKELIVDVAIRSGENGIFSVGNCVALYHVMKVAIPEELAMVLVRHAVFGPERRADWFHDKFSYYTETENSYFALRLLDSYPQLVRAHHGAFAVQAYQALGSSTHQARMHELGLLLLVLRLRELSETFASISERDLIDGLADLDQFFWTHTRIPSFEDFEGVTGEQLAELFGKLCEVDSMESAGALLGYDPRFHAIREPGRERFLARLATRIARHLQIITSLGIPVLYRSPSDGKDRMLLGPYVAPVDSAIERCRDLDRIWGELAERHGLEVETVRDWVIANNGFVDLRPLAIGTVATDASPGLTDQVQTLNSRAELEAWLSDLPTGTYFTTCGTLALELRLARLGRAVCRRKIRLGTRETWKHLFKEDRQGRHLISPGLVETVRLYSEGLGKITGTEALWPRWGY
ncbi:MAG: hypothetical protein AAF560_09000 [Acidobacteriota bacterium]